MTVSAGRRTAVVEPPMRGLGDLTRADYRAVLVRVVAKFREDDVPGLAAGVAFKIFLAFFPSLIAAVAVYGLVLRRGGISQQIQQLATVLPSEAQELLEEALTQLARTDPGAARSIAAVGALAALVSATGAAATLIKALNRAYGITDLRNFLAQRLVGLALTGALLLALGSLIVLVVAGEPLQRLLLPAQLEVPLVEVPLAVARYTLALGVLTALFAFTYSIGPNRQPPRWEWLSPGAVVGVLGWILVAVGFRLYTAMFGNYGSVAYGTVGGVIVFLLWLQLSILAMLVGAELNAALERIRAERAASRADVLGPDGLHPEETADLPPEAVTALAQDPSEEDPQPG
jgi:membrane protein